jgi:hypothetical protein
MFFLVLIVAPLFFINSLMNITTSSYYDVSTKQFLGEITTH